MFPHSTILNPVFWIVLGLLYAFVFSSAKIWAEDLRLKMNWWKWTISIVWFLFINLVVAAVFTLFGEDEPKAAWYFLGVFGFLSIVLGFVVWKLISKNKDESQPELSE